LALFFWVCFFGNSCCWLDKTAWQLDHVRPGLQVVVNFSCAPHPVTVFEGFNVVCLGGIFWEPCAPPSDGSHIFWIGGNYLFLFFIYIFWSTVNVVHTVLFLP
jgi:hypothetical protein